MLTNPFYYGGAITDEHFCNRVQELKELKADIKMSQKNPTINN